MAIPFLSEIERLITERGSAAILRERIALANEKYAALERKVLDLESRTAQLEAEIAKLESEKDALHRDKRELESKVAQLTQGSGPDARLEELKEKILVAIATIEDITARDLAYRLGISPLAVDLHLDELREASLVRRILRTGHQSEPWCLDQDGKKYLVRHGLA